MSAEPPEPCAETPLVVGLRARAETTAVADLMLRAATCLNPEHDVDAVLRLFLEKGIGSAPLVDPAWRPQAVVSRTDLLRALSGPDAAAVAATRYGPVSDIATPYVLTLPEAAPVSVAAALMAYEGVHRLPVVAADGEVVGVLSALDIIKWVARQTDSQDAPPP